MTHPSFKEWLETRPDSIKKIAMAYPPGKYRIKEGAPYGVSCPGTVVEIYSYHESGEVSVMVRSSEKTQAARFHEEMLGMRFGKTKEEIDKIHASDILVAIDPKWMEREKPMTRQRAGQRGGLTTSLRHGSEFYERIGRKGGMSRKK